MLVVSRNPLGEYVSRFRQNGRWSREDLATFAKKKGHQISASYIQKIEGGVDPDTISAGKYDALAAVLRLSPEQVRLIAKGAAPGLMSQGDQDHPSGLDISTSERHQRQETRKPWSGHDFSHSSGQRQGPEGSAGDDKELSKVADRHIGKGNHRDILDTRTGDTGHIMPLTADFGPLKRLPVFRVSCGKRLFVNDTPEEWQVWPTMITGPADGVMLVEGDSMLGAGFRPGDHLFYQLINGKKPQSGDTVVAEVNGGAVCKVYQKAPDGSEYLVSSPEDEDARFFALVGPDVRLVGIVKKHLRNI